MDRGHHRHRQGRQAPLYGLGKLRELASFRDAFYRLQHLEIGPGDEVVGLCGDDDQRLCGGGFLERIQHTLELFRQLGPQGVHGLPGIVQPQHGDAVVTVLEAQNFIFRHGYGLSMIIATAVAPAPQMLTRP
jgi:hypothetical protein